MLRKLPPLQLNTSDEEKVQPIFDRVRDSIARDQPTLFGERTHDEVLEAIYAKVEMQNKLGRWLPTRVATRDLEWDIAKECWEADA